MSSPSPSADSTPHPIPILVSSESGSATLEEIIITRELERRASRPPDHAAENRALVALAEAMAVSPETVLQKLADTARQLCQAGSAGISIAESQGAEPVFRWYATAGELAPYCQKTLPCYFSPSGVVLERNAMQLMRDPARYYPYIAQLRAPVIEVLLVPFYRAGVAVGTVWVVSHCTRRQFDAEDARLMQSLARFASAAVQALHTAQDAHRSELELRRSEARLRFLVDLNIATQPLTDPDEIMNRTAEMLGRHLHVSRCAYAEVEKEDEDTFKLTGNYLNGVKSITGRFTFTQFGETVSRLMRQNRAYVVRNVETDPQVGPDRSAYHQTEIAAVICVPLHKAGRFVAAMAVHQNEPRDWTQDEIELVQFVVNRCWESIERARVTHNLRETDQRKTEFLATLAHELRNPLAPIRSGLQILKHAGSNTAAAQTVKDMMERQVAHMVRLIDDLIDISRITRGKLALKKEPVALRTVIKMAIETSLHFIQAARHEFLVELPEEEITLNADITRLAQVFSNILTNAAKYTPEGGRIRLFAEYAAGTISVHIHDNGLGIAPEQLHAVFGMFTQLDRTLDRAQGGLGIGLTLAQQLTQMHGGEITAQSPGLGKGSTFTVWLPVAAQ